MSKKIKEFKEGYVNYLYELIDVLDEQMEEIDAEPLLKKQQSFEKLTESEGKLLSLFFYLSGKRNFYATKLVTIKKVLKAVVGEEIEVDKTVEKSIEEYESELVLNSDKDLKSPTGKSLIEEIKNLKNETDKRTTSK